MHFEPYDWFIGTGEYFVDFEDIIKKDVLDYDSKLNKDKNNYFFILDYDKNTLLHIIPDLINKPASDVTNIENHKIFNNGYPTGSPPTMPSSYDPAQGVTITYVSGTASTYCLRGNSLLVPSVVLYMTQAISTPTASACT